MKGNCFEKPPHIIGSPQKAIQTKILCIEPHYMFLKSCQRLLTPRLNEWFEMLKASNYHFMVYTIDKWSISSHKYRRSCFVSINLNNILQKSQKLLPLKHCKGVTCMQSSILTRLFLIFKLQNEITALS